MRKRLIIALIVIAACAVAVIAIKRATDPLKEFRTFQVSSGVKELYDLSTTPSHVAEIKID